jgi:hypothetical protein
VVLDLADKEIKIRELSYSKTRAEEMARDKSLTIFSAPPPTAVGDENIAILRHGIYIGAGEWNVYTSAGIELEIKNVSGKIIGSALLEAVFYGVKGNTLDTVQYKISELCPDFSRTIRILSSKPIRDRIISYNVRIIRTAIPPEPVVTGNDRITILYHSYSEAVVEDKKEQHKARIELAIRNVSSLTIATIVFEAIFYDVEGNIVETVKHSETELKANCSRAIFINSSVKRAGKFMTYKVRIIRMTTADVERVQLGWRRMTKTGNGDVEIIGKLTNISDAKADSAVIAAFYNAARENIGTKVFIFKGIEPGVRQFNLVFEPREGDRVADFSLDLGDIQE